MCHIVMHAIDRVHSGVPVSPQGFEGFSSERWDVTKQTGETPCTTQCARDPLLVK